MLLWSHPRCIALDFAQETTKGVKGLLLSHPKIGVGDQISTDLRCPVTRTFGPVNFRCRDNQSHSRLNNLAPLTRLNQSISLLTLVRRPPAQDGRSHQSRECQDPVEPGDRLFLQHA